jgi:hypothetical protein
MFGIFKLDLLPLIADPVAKIIIQLCEIFLPAPIAKNSYAKS